MTANLTGSLRLLVGLGWPMIYVTAATFHRRSSKQRLNEIVLEDEHAVEIIFLLVAIAYFAVIWFKGTLNWVDAVVLSIIYFVYLYFPKKIPPQEEEKIEDMDRIPRFILRQRRPLRNAMIGGMFGLHLAQRIYCRILMLFVFAPPLLISKRVVHTVLTHTIVKVYRRYGVRNFQLRTLPTRGSQLFSALRGRLTFQGRSSSIRLIGWSAIRVRTCDR